MNSQDTPRIRLIGLGTLAVTVLFFFVIGCGGNDSAGSAPGSQPTGGPGGGISAPGVNIPPGVSGVSAECLALAQGFVGMGQLLTGAAVDARQINAQFTRAAGGNLPNQVKNDLTTVLAGLSYPGGYSQVSPEQQTKIAETLTRLQAYAARECIPKP